MNGMTHRVRLVSGTSLVSSLVMHRTVVAFVDWVRCYSVRRRCLVGRLGVVYRFFFLPDCFEFGLGLEWSHVWSHSWVSPHIGVSLLRMDREFCGH